MTDEKILEIADKYDSGDKYGTAATWNFITEDLIAFVRAVIEEEREQSSFMTLRPSNGVEIMRIDKEGMVFMGQRITDAGEAYEAWMKTMDMMQGREKRKPLSDKEIEDLAEEFHEGFVFTYLKFARAIEKAYGIGETE